MVKSRVTHSAIKLLWSPIPSKGDQSNYNAQHPGDKAEKEHRNCVTVRMALYLGVTSQFSPLTLRTQSSLCFPWKSAFQG